MKSEAKRPAFQETFEDVCWNRNELATKFDEQKDLTSSVESSEFPEH